MELSEKETKIVFKYHYNKLSSSQKRSIRDTFYFETHKSFAYFYKALNNNDFTPIEYKLMLDLFKEYDIN